MTARISKWEKISRGDMVLYAWEGFAAVGPKASCLCALGLERQSLHPGLKLQKFLPLKKYPGIANQWLP